MAKRTDVGGGQTAAPNLDPNHELPANTGGTFQQAKDQASSLASGAKDQAKDLAQGAKEQAKSLASDAKEQAKDMANQARDHVQTLVGEQKGQAAERLHALADALREAGRKLNEGQQAGDFGSTPTAPPSRSRSSRATCGTTSCVTSCATPRRSPGAAPRSSSAAR
jgi:uncharacterized protein YjbJ (UPF0337 family)